MAMEALPMSKSSLKDLSNVAFCVCDSELHPGTAGQDAESRINRRETFEDFLTTPPHSFIDFLAFQQFIIDATTIFHL